MSNVLLCLGEYAKTPYYIEEDGRNIYSIEELCYYLYHQAYLMEDSFVTQKLGEWIAEQLKLSALGKEIFKLAGKPDALSKLMTLLSENVGYYEKQEWETLIYEIGRHNKLSAKERKKHRADGFLNSKKYIPALEEYEAIIRETRADDIKLRAKVYHNMGVCHAKLFSFENAAKSFEKSFELLPNTDTYVSMLVAMKFYMKPTEYLDYLSKHKESYEDSLEVERKCELLKLDWKRQPAYKFFEEITNLRQQGSAYYDGIISMAREAREDYRDCVSRKRGFE